ncbi:hypothetical protein [Lactobacillus sp. PSON]|uniref:hypothetical protein n=1 Tax=Lactobacillus sp. PSON TaxID=3455454 RepID=UPI0040427DCB
MKKFVSMVIRILVFLAGIALSGFLVWQLMNGVSMLDMNVETKGPVIVVIFGLLLLITLGTAISFLANRHMVSTLFLGALLAIIAFVLWIRHPDQGNIYTWYFVYGLASGVLSPFVISKEQ